MSHAHWYLFRDSVYGYQAAAPSRSMAWMLIRNKCYENKEAIPTMDKIIEVKKLTPYEIANLKA